MWVFLVSTFSQPTGKVRNRSWCLEVPLRGVKCERHLSVAGDMTNFSLELKGNQKVFFFFLVFFPFMVSFKAKQTQLARLSKSQISYIIFEIIT